MLCSTRFALPRALGSLALVILAVGCSAAVDRSSDSTTLAAVSDTEGVDLFHVGPVRVGLGKWYHHESNIPPGNPTYVIEIPDPGTEPMKCQIDTYYGIESTRPGLRVMDDNDGLLAALPNDVPYDGSQTLEWNYMVYGVAWTLAGGHGVQLILRPTTPLVERLRVEAVCHPR